MTQPIPAPQQAPTGTRLALASRGDALTPFLFDALARRFPVAGRIDPELSSRQRYQVAAMTVRLGRDRWVERFYKSGQAFRYRSANAARQLAGLGRDFDVAFQVHALFDLPQVPSVLYVDCTHRQAAESWPAWNPLSGAPLDRWYRRETAQYLRAEHIFAFYDDTARSLIEDYGVPHHRVTVTGAGINLDRPPTGSVSPAAAAAGPPAADPTILFIGNDFVRKGGEVLLEAFRTVRRAVPCARLQLVGTRPQISAEPGVEILGRIGDRARVAELYRGAAVFAMPSFFDPFPLVVLEAMAFGVPVVATRQCGVPDMIRNGRTGTLVEPGDPRQLAAALLDVLQNPGRAANLGTAGRDHAVREFTWDAVVDRMAPALAGLTRS